MSGHRFTSNAPASSLVRRGLVLLVAVQIAVVLLPASAAGQEEPVPPDAPAQEVEPTPDSEPAEPTADQPGTPAPEPDPTANEEQEPEPAPVEEDAAEPAPAEEQEPTACVSQGTESVVTDQSAYESGATARVAGSGFADSCQASIDVRPAEGGSALVVVEVETTADGQLEGDYLVEGEPGTYEVRVLGADDEVLASATFTVTADDPSPDECAVEGTGSVATDKSEYAPKSTVHVTGGGYALSCDLQVEVTRPDGSVDTADVEVAPAVEEPDAASSALGADDSANTGGFQYDYALGDMTGRYEVRVVGPADEALASTTFAVEAEEPPPPRCERRGRETIATDKADYRPSETVHMTGSGYARSCVVRVRVVRPDGSVVRGDGSFEPGVDEVLTTARGRLVYDYVLNGIEGLYKVRVLGAGNVLLAKTTFTDQIRAAPSDPRATFFDGNATTCGDVGYPDDVWVGAQGNADASDAYVVGTGTATSPTRLNVEITPAGVAAGVVIDAVVVKGSNGYNVYEDPFVPPDEAPPQNYQSPATNPNAPIADISHWYVCYTFGELGAPDEGSLLVLKRVVSPAGPTVQPLPSEPTVDVTCTDGTTDTFVFGQGGGVGRTTGGGVLVTGIDVGSTCTVVEQDTGSLPDGTTVTYIPASAPSSGVTMGPGVGVVVFVNNNFSDIETLTGTLQVVKEVVPGPVGVEPPDSWTIEVACSDGTIQQVTVPGTGGVGTPTLEDITLNAYCLVAELGIGSFPPELEITYSGSDPPIFVGPQGRIAIFRVVDDSSTLEMTVTNDLSGIPPTPGCPDPSDPTDPDCPDGGEGPGGSGVGGAGAGGTAQPRGDLPLTGGPAVLLGAIGLMLLVGGAVLVSRRTS